MRQYPFRFYGREPADWTPSEVGFLYDVQFETRLDGEARAAVRLHAERHFSRGPAGMGEVWRWADDRFLLFSVEERFEDAARMVFTQVAEFLSVLNQTARIRDVVFCNGSGARADRWDAWSMKQQPQPDAGPARPSTPWASLLRRPERASMAWDAPSARRQKPVAEVTAEAPAPATKRPRTNTKQPFWESPVAQRPVSELEALVSAGWAQLSAAFEGVTLERVVGPSIPIGWAFDAHNRRAAIVCFNGQGAPQRIDLAPTFNARVLAVDPDGLHAVTHDGNTVYSLDVPTGVLRARSAIHENNGAVASIAWAVDDLWAVRVATQCIVFDLSEEEAAYVGTVQPPGELVGIFRHGTVAAFFDQQQLRLFGVCEWQLHELGALDAKGARPVIHDDVLYLQRVDALTVVEGIDARYEAWAAPLRRRAEEDRQRRLAPAETGLRWRWTPESEMPADREKIRRKALRAKWGDMALVHLLDSGDAVVGVARPKRAISRGARLRWCPVKGRARVLKAPKVAWNEGLTAATATADGQWMFFITGTTFHLHRAALDDSAIERCEVQHVTGRGGLFYDLAAVSRDDVIAVWNDTVDWHRETDGRWVRVAAEPVDLPRGYLYDAPSRRFALMQQSRERLVLWRLGDGVFERLAAFTDAVKLASFREGRLFAQMIDGQWFEVLGAEAAR